MSVARRSHRRYLPTDSLVWANLFERPARTLASMAGVALGVVLVVVTVGLARGALESRGERESNVGAEILFQPPGAIGLEMSTAPLTLPVSYAAELSAIEGVRAATPVGRFLRRGERGIGFELIEGIVTSPKDEHADYFQTTGIRIIEGRRPQEKYEALVDQVRAEDPTSRLGMEIEILGRPFEIVGVYAPEAGARIKIPLATMQELLGSEDECSWVFVRCASPDQQEAVAARIRETFPDFQIIFTRDIPTFVQRGTPALDVFIDVVIGLATLVSGLVILLAMYTSALERTREVGILKSLGASRRFIVALFEKEALLIAALGIGAGLVISLVVKAGITRFSTLAVSIELRWVLIASLIGILASLAGAAYPALRAASVDPVEALSHE